MSLREKFNAAYNEAIRKTVFAKHEKLTLGEKTALNALKAYEMAVGLTIVTYYIGKVGLSFVAFPVLRLYDKWATANRPLDAFEPKEQQQAPYWQNLVFGDGRLEKLLGRLQGLPHVNDEIQKWTLERSEGGLRVLPGHRELVKYGLSDTAVAKTARGLSLRMSSLFREHSVKAGHDLLVKLEAGGRVAVEDAQTSSTFGECALGAWTMDTPLFYMYKDSGNATPDDTAEKIAAAVHAWLIEDVAPAVPRIFSDFEVHAHSSGSSLVLCHKPRGLDDRTSFFDLLREGYKGTLPASAAAVPRPDKNTPAPGL